MPESRVRTGAVILAVLAVSDILGSLLLPAPAEAPPWASAIGVGFGVVTLAALAVWWRSSGRAALWVAVVVRVLSALLPVLGLADPLPAWIKISVVVTLIVTVIGVVLVRPALARRAGVPARTA